MNRRTILSICCGVLLTLAGFSLLRVTAQQRTKPGLYAIFQTDQGTIVCELFENDAPIAVKNFVDLAQGQKEFTDPKTGTKKKDHYYDGTTFYSAIPKFGIQGGDPTGTGTGDPGYKFQDEFNPTLRFDKPGRLATANSGPNTNGSQFFITEVPAEFLNNKHTIFGQVIEGLDVVRKIAHMPKDTKRTPYQPAVLKKLTIERVRSSGF